MNFQTPEIYFFAVSLVYVVVMFMLFLFKYNHVCKPLQNDVDYFFPARKAVALSYAAQTVDIIYVFNVFSPENLMFVNAVPLILTPFFCQIVFEEYFIHLKQTWRKIILQSIPVLIALLIIGYAIFNATQMQSFLGANSKLIIMVATIFAGAISFAFLVQTVSKMYSKLVNVNMMECSNKNDFSYELTKFHVFTPIIWFSALVLVFVCNSQEVKMVRDILFLICVVFFPIYNLNTNRNDFEVRICKFGDDFSFDDEFGEKAIGGKKLRLSDEKLKILQEQILFVLEKKQMFLNPHLKLQDVANQLCSNRNYVSEAISLSEYGSFYKMVNYFRVEYAIKFMSENTQYSLDSIASECGFSSRQTLFRAFKDLKMKSPSEYRA